MGTVWVREFKGGLDTRRLVETSLGGTLIHAQDCHVTQGGEIEQRADFVPLWTAENDTCVGLAATPDNLVVFGHLASDPVGMPDPFIYQQLAHPTGEVLLRVPSWVTFGEELAAIGRFRDNAGQERYVFLDGVLISDANAPPQTNRVPFSLATFAKKLFIGAGPVLFFSDIEDGADFTGAGAGFVNMAFQLGTDPALRCIAPYEDWLALFFPNTIMIWAFGADPDTDTLPIQTLDGTGARGPRSAVQFQGDVLFYSPSGIRSLRARNSTKSATTVDIGSAVDSLTRAAFEAMTFEGREGIISVVEPATGRVWFAAGDTIFVLSHYDVTKVTAWSVYKPGFNVDGMAVFGNRVYLRGGNTFYVYGSTFGPYSYSADVQAEAWLPYLDADTPSQKKKVTGIDAAVRGTWEIRIGYDPENLDATDLVARIAKTTYPDMRIPVDQGEGTHVGLRFKSTAPVDATTPAVLSSAVIHHNLDDQVDSS